MASNITLSAGVRSNLLNLQNTADLKNVVQGRLSTGKKVNTALDNPSNYFTAASLTGRSTDLSALLDGISNGIQTLKAADNGVTAITSSIESLQATVRQARQDKSFQSASYALDATAIGTSAVKTLAISGGAVGSTVVNIPLNTVGASATAATYTAPAAGTPNIDLSGAGNSVNLTINGTAVSIDATKLNTAGGTAGVGTLAQLATAINTDFAANGGTGVTASVVGGKLTFATTATGANTNVSITGFSQTTSNATSTGLANGAATGTDAGAVKTIDQIVDLINNNAALTGKVKASNDSGKLRIENDSTSPLSVGGYNTTTATFDGSGGIKTVGANDVRNNLVTQFNDVRDQLNKLADDASFNGINLLKGDKLKLNFNETSTSSVTVQSSNPNGINTDSLGITVATSNEFGSDDALDARLDQLSNALTSLRAQSSAFGSKMSIIQNRQDFTKNLMNTLQTGADNLTLADTNEEGANLLALNTRQQLQTTSLSFASQADQAVLQFLR